MRTKICTLFIIIFSICTTGLAQSITIKESDNGKTFSVKKGSTFNVLFKKECIGCATAWASNGLDSTWVKQVSSTYSNPSCKNCMGGNHDHTFKFKAMKAGTAALSFANGDKTFNVKVKVK